jgi:selenocysteine lyase/cysteine desulfurase
MGPKEAGILYVRAETIDRLRASDVGVGWSRALEGGARKYESLGQRDDACVAAIEKTVVFHERIGADVIEARLLEITRALKAGLRERIPTVEFHTPMGDETSSGVMVFRVPGADMSAAYQTLYSEHRVGGAGRGGEFDGIRLSPHIYNTLADVDYAIDAIAEVTA